MKKEKILKQINGWINQLNDQTSKRKSVNQSLKSYLNEIKIEFAKLEKNMEKKEEVSTPVENEQSKNNGDNDDTNVTDNIPPKEEPTDSYSVTEAVYL